MGRRKRVGRRDIQGAVETRKGEERVRICRVCVIVRYEGDAVYPVVLEVRDDVRKPYLL